MVVSRIRRWFPPPEQRCWQEVAGGLGVIPGAWVSPARPLPPMPQREQLLGDGYQRAGTGQSWG